MNTFWAAHIYLRGIYTAIWHVSGDQSFCTYVALRATYVVQYCGILFSLMVVYSFLLCICQWIVTLNTGKFYSIGNEFPVAQGYGFCFQIRLKLWLWFKSRQGLFDFFFYFVMFNLQVLRLFDGYIVFMGDYVESGIFSRALRQKFPNLLPVLRPSYAVHRENTCMVV